MIVGISPEEATALQVDQPFTIIWEWNKRVYSDTLRNTVAGYDLYSDHEWKPSNSGLPLTETYADIFKVCTLWTVPTQH